MAHVSLVLSGTTGRRLRSFFSRRTDPLVAQHSLQSSRPQATNCQIDTCYLTEMSQELAAAA